MRLKWRLEKLIATSRYLSILELPSSSIERLNTMSVISRLSQFGQTSDAMASLRPVLTSPFFQCMAAAIVALIVLFRVFKNCELLRPVFRST